MRRLLKSSALALALAPGIAQAAEPPCLTPAEFTALALYALPSLIGGTAQRCATVLPPEAYLQRNGTDLAARYGAAKPGAWPEAKRAFLKLSSGTNAEATEMFKSMPDPSLRAMADTLIAGMIAQRLPTERCGVIDRVVRLLAPLPPENTAELIAVAAGLGARSGKAGVGNFSLCPA